MHQECNLIFIKGQLKKQGNFLFNIPEKRLTVLKQLREPKAGSQEIENMLQRFQQDTERRRVSQKTREKLLKVEEKQMVNNKPKISKAESDQFYERLMNAKKVTEELNNAKRKMINKIREEEEMREVRKTQPKSQEEIQQMLRRFELDAARRHNEAKRLEVIKDMIQEMKDQDLSNSRFHRSQSTSKIQGNSRKAGTSPLKKKSPPQTSKNCSEFITNEYPESTNGFGAVADKAMNYNDDCLIKTGDLGKNYNEYPDSVEEPSQYDNTNNRNLHNMIQEALKEEIQCEVYIEDSIEKQNEILPENTRNPNKKLCSSKSETNMKRPSTQQKSLKQKNQEIVIKEEIKKVTKLPPKNARAATSSHQLKNDTDEIGHFTTATKSSVTKTTPHQKNLKIQPNVNKKSLIPEPENLQSNLKDTQKYLEKIRSSPNLKIKEIPKSPENENFPEPIKIQEDYKPNDNSINLIPQNPVKMMKKPIEIQQEPKITKNIKKSSNLIKGHGKYFGK